MKKKRPYRMSERAKSQEETRLRIVEATMKLHEEIGPRATTISAIAEEAGVRRLTVYRHFPDETAVFQACTSHWLSLNPPPNPETWMGHDDPWKRLRVAVGEFYAYYSRTRRMWTVSFRDVRLVPALQEPMGEFEHFVASIAAGLAEPFGARGARQQRLETTLAHILAFPTWADLHERGLEAAAMLATVEHWVHGVVDGK